jgi:prepilin-type N-terminal cleavage/methylation domain-containing protein
MFKNYFQKNKKAFTLVELLVVIAIIGILATLAVVALQQARSRARDSKRVADVKQTQTALELFFNEQGRYPTVEEWNSGTLITSSGEMLMIDIPSAPYPADGVCDASQNTFYYQVDDDYSSYSISFCLGSDFLVYQRDQNVLLLEEYWITIVREAQWVVKIIPFLMFVIQTVKLVIFVKVVLV